MDAAEYADFEARHAQGMEGLSFFSSGSLLEACHECCSAFGNPDAVFENGVSYDCEPYFSWWRCSICDSKLGGNRTHAHAYFIDADGEQQLAHLRVCDDCVYYAEYGRLDDTTMAEVNG